MADCRAADIEGWLTPAQQALIHWQDWLRMLAPRACGGAELPLPQVVRLEQALAAQDGSIGWVVTLCAGAGWFAGFLAPERARAIMATPNVCVAGSGAPTGYADRDGDGFRIAGRWDYASGAPMATHFTLNAVLRERGQVLLDGAGRPRIRAFIVPERHVTPEPTWRSIGLRASASHSYRIDNAWVPADHGFTIAPEAATAPGPLYRFPFMPLAFVTLGANLLGMAQHFLALARPLLASRPRPRPPSTSFRGSSTRRWMLPGPPRWRVPMSTARRCRRFHCAWSKPAVTPSIRSIRSAGCRRPMATAISIASGATFIRPRSMQCWCRPTEPQACAGLAAAALYSSVERRPS